MHPETSGQPKCQVKASDRGTLYKAKGQQRAINRVANIDRVTAEQSIYTDLARKTTAKRLQNPTQRSR